MLGVVLLGVVMLGMVLLGVVLLRVVAVVVAVCGDHAHVCAVQIPEHTWGEDTTWYLHDYLNWTNAQIDAAMLQVPKTSRTIPTRWRPIRFRSPCCTYTP